MILTGMRMKHQNDIKYDLYRNENEDLKEIKQDLDRNENEDLTEIKQDLDRNENKISKKSSRILTVTRMRPERNQVGS